MRASVSLHKFMATCNFLYFPFVWVRWLLLIGLISLCVGFVLKSMYSDIWMMVLSSISLVVVFFLMAFNIPGQLAAIASSKQMLMLGNIKIYLVVSMFLFCISAAALIIFFAIIFGKTAFPLGHLSAAFCIISLLLCVLTFVSKCNYGVQSITPFLSVIFLMQFLGWFVAQPVAITLVLALCGWVLFLAWFFSWRPQYYHANKAYLSGSDILKNSQSLIFINSRFISKPKTLHGTLLFGYADNYLTHFKNTLIAVTFFAVSILVMRILVPFDSLRSILIHMGVFLIVFSSLAAISAFFVSIYKNMHKQWLFSFNSRVAIFGLTENNFGIALLFSIAIVPLLYFFVSLIIGFDVISPCFLSLVTVYTALFFYMLFYVAMIIYVKYLASFSVFMWVSACSLFVLLVPLLILSVDFWDYSSKRFIWGIGVALCIQCVSIFMLRCWARRLWQKVNFIKVRN